MNQSISHPVPRFPWRFPSIPFLIPLPPPACLSLSPSLRFSPVSPPTPSFSPPARPLPRSHYPPASPTISTDSLFPFSFFFFIFFSYEFLFDFAVHRPSLLPRQFVQTRSSTVNQSHSVGRAPTAAARSTQHVNSTHVDLRSQIRLRAVGLTIETQGSPFGVLAVLAIRWSASPPTQGRIEQLLLTSHPSVLPFHRTTKQIRTIDNAALVIAALPSS